MTESTISIKDIDSIEQMREVEDLQMGVWGMDGRDIVPVTQLVAAIQTGGALVGAFERDRLVGFVYGFVGLEGNQVSIHSHMLAVDPAYRNQNLGYRLKLAQRERALAQGISTITWTFDPLQSVNAHLNFSKLGVLSDRYKIDFYGPETSSILHQIGTDRLWLSWPLESQRVKQRLQSQSHPEPMCPEIQQAPRLLRRGTDNIPRSHEPAQELGDNQIVIEIPDNINAIQKQNPGLAVQWREATRWAFTEAMAAGYLVEEFYRLAGRGQSGGAYLLGAGKQLSDCI